MAPKDSFNLDRTSQFRSPMDLNVNQLRSISGTHQWINTHDRSLVDNVLYSSSDLVSEFLPQKQFFTPTKTNVNDNGRMDLSLPHFDVQLQVTDGQLGPVIRYEVFAFVARHPTKKFKISQCTQTNNEFSQPEMDMENGDHGRNQSYRNGHSSNNNNNNNRNSSDQPSRHSTNGSSGGANGDGNGFNPNRNNNNSRRPPDHNDESEEDADDDDNETDENLARRLAFRPIDNETIRTIGRLRSLTHQQSFVGQDLDNLQYLIDELIRLQRLETFSREQLEKVVYHLKLHRPLRTKAEALAFIQSRLPHRTSFANQNESNSNVFNIWRERERRARLDSKDSLEDEPQNGSGQQLRDVTEINHPTPPVMIQSQSNGRSKVKQMARDIDTRSIPLRSTETHRSASPSPINVIHIPVVSHNVQSTDSFNRTETRRPVSNGNTADQHRVRQMIDRLESSSSNADRHRTSTPVKKYFHEEHSDNTTSYTSLSPATQRVARREIHQTTHHSNGNDDSLNFRHRSPNVDVFIHRSNPSETTRFELDREEIRSGGRRTASGTTIDEYVTSLLPGTETSVSMVRDVRARLYEDESAVSTTHADHVPMKVDVETLYILEQKSERKSLPSPNHVFTPDHNRVGITERHDFAMQTTIPTSIIKPPHRPVGTQVDSTIEHHTVSAQTTDSLHRPSRERLPLPSAPSPINDGENSKITTTTITTTRHEIRRHSSHHTSEDEAEDADGTVIYIDGKDQFQYKSNASLDDQLPVVPDQRSSFGHVSSRIRIDPLHDLNRQIVRRHSEQQETYHEEQNQHRSNEVYEIHTRGACKCLVISMEEKTQYGPETRFEKQLQHIERTYTEEELKSTELHVIVSNSDRDYQLVRRDYGSHSLEQEYRPSMITIHYYNKDGQRMRTENGRHLEHLPLFIRCEIEYELNHYGSAPLIILAVTNADRRQTNVTIKKEIVNEIVAHSGGHLPPNSPQLENEIARQLSESISLLHLVDYSSRDDYHQTNSTDLRRVSRLDATTSLRLVQRHRTVIHRLCQSFRSHLRLTPQAEQQRHLILVARDEYYLFDLTKASVDLPPKRTEYRQETVRKEVQHVPFDYAKYRQEAEAQRRFFEQRYRQQQQIRQSHQGAPPPPGHPSEAEFYLGSGRRAMIEREIHSMRESIRPHEQAPPRYKHEPRRRSLSICFSGAQRYVRARIIHVKDYYEDHHQQRQQEQKNAKEQELFVRVDDYINEAAANSLRRSYSTDYLHEDGPRSRIRYIRIPGETIRIEEKTTYEYQGVMYANLPYSLRYWNILHILDREAREGRALGSTLPQIIVNDPYQTVIPPLTQQEIRQTAQQVLAPQYHVRSPTDQTLRWFLSRDNRTEIESAKYLQTLNQYRHQHQQQRQHEQHKRTAVRVEGNRQIGTANKYYVTETLVRYEKMPDRLVPVPVQTRAQSIDNLHHRSPSTTSVIQQQSFQAQRSQSQPRPPFTPTMTGHQFSSMAAPLSRHQSVHELHVPTHLSHPPSPSPSLHSLHSHHQSSPHRRPVAYNTRYQPRPFASSAQQQQQHPLLTEIIDSQTGRRILTTSQEQLPSEVLGLLNKYNLQQF